MTSSVQLEFVVNEDTLEEYRGWSPVQWSLGMLQVGAFELPVRLRVGDVELLQDDPISVWFPLPLLALAMDENVQKLARGVQLDSDVSVLILDYQFSIRLHPDGNRVQLHCTLNGRTASAPLEDVAIAFRKYIQDVRMFIIDRVPELRQHAELHDWLTQTNDQT
jgi:hypothetical protein